MDASAEYNKALVKRFDVTYFPTILVWKPDERGARGEANGPTHYKQEISANALYDHVMDLNYNHYRKRKNMKDNQEARKAFESEYPTAKLKELKLDDEL